MTKAVNRVSLLCGDAERTDYIQLFVSIYRRVPVKKSVRLGKLFFHFNFRCARFELFEKWHHFHIKITF